MGELSKRGTAEVFEPLKGQLVWGVRRGVGSFLLLEFGEPHRTIREPRDNKLASSDRLRQLLARRRVHILGDWHLEILYAHWNVATKSAGSVDDASDLSQIDLVLAELDGQALIDVRQGQQQESTIFTFDLGGLLTLRPASEYDPADDQWCLYQYGGSITAWRNDGELVVDAQ